MKNPDSTISADSVAGDQVKTLSSTILCLGRVFERRLGRILATTDLGVTTAQARIVMRLHFNGPLSQQELAAQIDVVPSTIVGTLDVLEREGLASREPDPSDRRAHLVRLTEAGQALVPGLFGILHVVETEIAEVLPERERARLQESLDRLIERLSMGDEVC